MKIESLTHHAMGRTADGALFERCLPGEEIDDEGRIVTPSPDRVAAPCSHFKSCGGCSMQHANDDFVADWKAGIIRQALAAHGLDAPLRRTHTSPANSRRRAKLSARRTKKGALVGFHARASDVILEVPNCQVLHPAILALIPALEELTTQLASRKSELALTVTHSESGPDVLVTGARPLVAQDQINLADWATTHDIARLTVDDETILTRNAPFQRFGPAKVTPPPGAFLQATLQGQAALTAGVQEALAGCKTVADLFSGSGTFSLPLAEDSDVTAYESVTSMTGALDHGWRMAQGIHQVHAVTRDLFRNPLEGGDLSAFDGIAIDPPRAGAAAQTGALATDGPAKIAYVSCNPVTFARDAAKLVQGGYQIDWIDVVDQFRWTAHVELIAAFRRA